MFLQWVPKRRRAKYLNGTKQQALFCTNDLHGMLTTAIQETKKRVQEEYNIILEKKLQEQFQVLSQVVNQNVNRKLENSAHDYVL